MNDTALWHVVFRKLDQPQEGQFSATLRDYSDSGFESTWKRFKGNHNYEVLERTKVA